MKSGKPTASEPVTGPADSRSTEPRRSTKRKVAVVDDHPMTRAGLVSFINGQRDLEVCFEAGDPATALRQLTGVVPDVVVTDMTMPGRSGIEFVKDVHAMRPSIPILVLSMHEETLYANRVIRAGAKGYLMKDAGGSKVIEVVRLLLTGGYYVSPKVSSAPVDSHGIAVMHRDGAPEARLSDREFQVFCRIGNGETTKEIAATLGLSPKTVDVHRGRIKEKLGMVDATSLFHHAVRWVQSQTGSPP